MKLFNGRTATEEYMSTHSLTFSTPEMTLKKFALWLGDQVSSPDGSGEQVPRLMLYLEEKGRKKESDLVPDTDDSFRPSGAVTDMYGGVGATTATTTTDQTTPPTLTPLNRETLEPEVGGGSRFCIECGNRLKPGSRFCTKCGTKQ